MEEGWGGRVAQPDSRSFTGGGIPSPVTGPAQGGYPLPRQESKDDLLTHSTFKFTQRMLTSFRLFVKVDNFTLHDS